MAQRKSLTAAAVEYKSSLIDFDCFLCVSNRFVKVPEGIHFSSYQKERFGSQFGNQTHKKRNSFEFWAKVISSARKHYKGNYHLRFDFYLLFVFCFLRFPRENDRRVKFLITVTTYERPISFVIQKMVLRVWWSIAKHSNNWYLIWMKFVTNTTMKEHWNVKGKRLIISIRFAKIKKKKKKSNVLQFQKALYNRIIFTN